MKFDGGKIKEFRLEKNLTQFNLVVEFIREGLQLSTVTLQKWEKGITIPKADDLAIMAIFFNKPIRAFFKEEAK